MEVRTCFDQRVLRLRRPIAMFSHIITNKLHSVWAKQAFPERQRKVLRQKHMSNYHVKYFINWPNVGTKLNMSFTITLVAVSRCVKHYNLCRQHSLPKCECRYCSKGIWNQMLPDPYFSKQSKHIIQNSVSDLESFLIRFSPPPGPVCK